MRHTFETVKSLVIFLAIILLLYAGWQMAFGYFYPYPYCNIDVKRDILRGDAQSIEEALATLRRNDAGAFKTACKYVDVIEEKRCFNAEGRVDRGAFKKTHEGCFIKGTHTIYLLPRKYDEETVRVRADAIRALSEKSRRFWEGAPRED